MGKLINWLKSLFAPKKEVESVSKVILESKPAPSKGKSGASKTTFTKSGSSKSTVAPKRKPRKKTGSSSNGRTTSGKSQGTI